MEEIRTEKHGSRHGAEMTQGLKQDFWNLFGSIPQIYRAPGRVNLIGEHTDYNDGFVMPAAIEFNTNVAIAARGDRKLLVNSRSYGEQIEFDLDHLPATRAGHWSDYVIGVAKILLSGGKDFGGANLLVDGDVPQGAGLSSSASIEVAVGYALLDGAGKDDGYRNIDRKELALLCQRAENEFVGARCGIMDQFIASHGQRDHALLLDCRSLEFRNLPLPDGVELAICNTMVKHSIAQGEYNHRRAECEEGVRILSQYLPHVRALRDVTLEDFENHACKLPGTVMRRCRHVISENARVLRAAYALEKSDLTLFGRLMLQSHQSLRDDFEVSCSELDLMVELAEKQKGCFGARMTGGGFGGCAIALVESGCVESFKRAVSQAYEKSFAAPEIYISAAADGVCRVP